MQQTSTTPSIQWLWLLISATAFFRACLAGSVALGNDEIYYRLYALYPDWSHFDHPPLVGLTIQIFSLNLLLDSEFFIRLGSVLLFAADSYLLYRIAEKLGDAWAALLAVVLFNASIYGSLLVGTFILPDSPQLFFWLLSLYILFLAVEKNELGPNFLLFGLSGGLAILSKYHGVFIWVGLGLYVLLVKRKWLLSPYLYGAVVLGILVSSPILIWNLQNQFISFSFQSGRVVANQGLRPDYFALELLGQMLYQNPIAFFMAIGGLILFFRKNALHSSDYEKVLVLVALPLWLVFTSFSLFRGTLPHWTGPAYATIWPLVAFQIKDAQSAWPLAKTALGLTAFFVLAAYIYLNFIPMQMGSKAAENLGENDETLDLIGWEQIREGFSQIRKQDLQDSAQSPTSPILSHKWFPAANLDYYVAKPLEMKLLAYGKLEDVHKFAWINRQRGGLEKGQHAYFLGFSNYPTDPKQLWGKNFESIDTAGVIRVKKAGLHVKTVWVYRLKNCVSVPVVEGFE
jgi:4-amino-4-deoxy-L-arabinose transferase-like glycosyltransferase